MTVVPLAFDANGIVAFIFANIVPLLFLAVGLGIIAASRRKDMSGATTQTGIIVIGLVVIGLGGAAFALSNQLANIITGQ